MERKRNISVDMSVKRCSLLPKSSYVNIAERDWKNNNRTEAFFDLLELPLKIIRDMICKYVDLSLNLHHEEGDSYTKRG